MVSLPLRTEVRPSWRKAESIEMRRGDCCRSCSRREPVLSCQVYAVSARETDRGYSGREDFWFIVAIRSEDEAEIRAGETAGGSGREGPPACDAPAVLGRGEDPHRARGPAG